MKLHSSKKIFLIFVFLLIFFVGCTPNNPTHNTNMNEIYEEDIKDNKINIYIGENENFSGIYVELVNTNAKNYDNAYNGKFYLVNKGENSYTNLKYLLSGISGDVGQTLKEKVFSPGDVYRAIDLKINSPGNTEKEITLRINEEPEIKLVYVNPYND